ncbi:MAG: hypothetical protein JSW53_01950 [Candidatus Bathyarchaeota archaeon]|nr:MAG: hypothetical protein JSW53_01950 [Candidatus Bathyarchaeota archaeon]
MSEEQIGSVVLEEDKRDLNAEVTYTDIDRLEIEDRCRVMSREEKMREASKPLYLMRYE